MVASPPAPLEDGVTDEYRCGLGSTLVGATWAVVAIALLAAAELTRRLLGGTR